MKNTQMLLINLKPLRIMLVLFFAVSILIVFRKNTSACSPIDSHSNNGCTPGTVCTTPPREVNGGRYSGYCDIGGNCQCAYPPDPTATPISTPTPIPTPTPTPTPMPCQIEYEQIPNQTFGISAVESVEFTWLDVHGTCPNFTFQLSAKTDKSDLADTSDCDFSSAQEFETEDTEINLNDADSSDIWLDWDNGYCWKVNNTSSSSNHDIFIRRPIIVPDYVEEGQLRVRSIQGVSGVTTHTMKIKIDRGNNGSYDEEQTVTVSNSSISGNPACGDCNSLNCIASDVSIIDLPIVNAGDRIELELQIQGEAWVSYEQNQDDRLRSPRNISDQFLCGEEVCAYSEARPNVTSIIESLETPLTFACWEDAQINDGSYNDFAVAIDFVPETLVIDAEIWTFRTNTPPVFARSGIQYTKSNDQTNLFDDSTTIAIDGDIGAGTRTCDASGNICTTESTSDDLGGDQCWFSGGSTDDGNINTKDNEIVLWFEYKDMDHGQNPGSDPIADHPNEAYEHRVAFVPQGNIDADDDSERDWSNVEEQADFYIKYNISNDSITLCERTGAVENCSNVDIIEIVDRHNYKEDATNSVRVSYRIKFLPDEGKSQLYDIYAFMANAVFDPIVDDFTLEVIPEDHSATTPETVDLSAARYIFRGQIGIDNVPPVINVPKPTILSFNSFAIEWEAPGETDGSGVGDFQAYCYSGEDEDHVDYSLYQFKTRYLEDEVLVEVDKSNELTIEYFENVPSTGNHDFGDYNECIDDTDKAHLYGADSNYLRTSHRFADTPDAYKDFAHLVIRVQAVEDAACNQGETSHNPQSLLDNWVSTKQGSFHTDKSIGFSRSSENLGYIKPENNLYKVVNSDLQIVYAKTDTPLLDLSSDFLSSFVDLNGNLSTTKQDITGYRDINNIPRYGVNGTHWSDYFENLSQIHQLYAQEQTNALDVTSILADPCHNANPCFVKIQANMTLSSQAVCDTRAIIVVDGYIELQDSLRNNSEDDACIFIAKDGIRFLSTETPLSANEAYKDINTSIYDTFEGFFISEGGEVYLQKDWMDNPHIIENVIYADGLYIKGGLVQSSTNGEDLTIARSLGLRNNIQPPVMMVFDPRYINVFLEILGYTNLRIKEMEF
jgi:hypothetical protein